MEIYTMNLKVIKKTSILCVCLALLCGCSNNSNSSATVQDTSTTTTDSIVTTTVTDTSKEEDTIETTPFEPVEYNELPIPMLSNSEYVTQDMCKEVSEYFNSMVNVDVDTFKQKHLPAYNSYLEDSLQDTNSNVEEMLKTYCNNILASNNDDTTNYTDFKFNNISLEYPNDYDSIMNTMNYIYQLDDITNKYDNYTLSKKLSAYYQLTYTIDYTLTGENLEDFNSSYKGSLLLLQMDGQTYLLML